MRRGIFAVLAAYFALHVFAGVTFLALRSTDPPVTALQIQRRVESWISRGSYEKHQRTVPVDRISRNLVRAVVAAEDGGFFGHGGIDWDELQKAVGENRGKRKTWRGGSTITQQLVKNLFFGTRVRWLTKGFEFTLAPFADYLLSKRRILELYLNVIEWGDGIYGAEAAARHYYRTSAASLNRDQAARLAAILPAPRRRHPHRMDRYARIILERMAGRGW